MSAEIRPLGAYSLCSCGTAVATMPIDGEIVCAECFDEKTKAKYPPPPALAVQVALDSGPSLSEILAKLGAA